MKVPCHETGLLWGPGLGCVGGRIFSVRLGVFLLSSALLKVQVIGRNPSCIERPLGIFVKKVENICNEVVKEVHATNPTSLLFLHQNLPGQVS